MNTQTKAMKLARLAINNLIASSHATDPQPWRDARQDAADALTAIDKALAEQPAPVQQEPVGYFSVNQYGRWEENESEYGQPFYASLPAEHYDPIGVAQDRLIAEQAAQKRPQNCGTGYCSCIKCVMEPSQQEPVGIVKDLFTNAAWDKLDVVGSTKVYLDFPPAQQEPLAWGIIASNTGRLCQVELDAGEVEGHNPKHIVPLCRCSQAPKENQS